MKLRETSIVYDVVCACAAVFLWMIAVGLSIIAEGLFVITWLLELLAGLTRLLRNLSATKSFKLTV